MGNTPGKDPPKKVPANGDPHPTEPIERSLVVVWCDGSIGAPSNSNDDINTLMQLALIVNRKRQLIHTFSEVEACKEFISHVNNICLIVSGQMGMQLVPLVHNLNQIHSIYIFCLNKPKYDLWAKQYEKVRGVYTDINDICDYIKKYYISQSTTSDHEQVQINVLKKNLSLPTVDKQEVPFIYSLLSKIILMNMNLIKREEMMNYCRTEYTSDYQKQLINEFDKNYSQHDPLYWFTRDNFLQRIINRALQIHDMFTLSMMTPFIQDLVKQLAQLHGQQQPLAPQTLELYSCQSMFIDDFDRLKNAEGGLVCINQFLFANSERAIPVMFIQHEISTATNSPIINVLFRISIAQTIKANVSFANIGVTSEFVHEREYLFSMSSMFRIEKIDKLDQVPSAWYVHLTFLDQNDPQLTTLTQFIKLDQLIGDYKLPELGASITNKLYQFKSTRKLFEQTLNSKTKQIRSSLLHYNMGVIYDCLNEYDKAVNDYKYAIDLTRQSILNGYSKDHLCLVPLYSNMGLSFQRLNMFPHAIDHAFRALNILSKEPDNSPFKKEVSASTHFNLGLIHDLEKKTSEAKIYYEQALKSRREYLSADHPDIISLENTLKSLSSQ